MIKMYNETSRKRLDLGLSVLVSRRSRDLFFKVLGLVSVSGNLGGSRSRSRLGLKTERLGLVSVSKLKVSFTSESFLTVKLLIQNKLSSSVRVSHNSGSRSRSRSRLGLKTKFLGLVSVSKPKVSPGLSM